MEEGTAGAESTGAETGGGSAQPEIAAQTAAAAPRGIAEINAAIENGEDVSDEELEIAESHYGKDPAEQQPEQQPAPQEQASAGWQTEAMQKVGAKCPELSDFTNWKSQGWYLLQNDLEAGNIDLSELAEKQPEEFRLLKKELLAHDMAINPQSGKKRVKPKEEVKKELGWSPGRADALVAWNWVRKRVDDMPRERTARTEPSEVSYLFP